MPLSGSFVDQSAWTSYVPSITAATNPITTVGTVTGRYKQIGKTIHLQIDAAITTAGTATGQLLATLPFTAASFNYMGSSRDFGVTGKGGPAYISTADSTKVAAIDATATTYFANGARVVIGITYEIP